VRVATVAINVDYLRIKRDDEETQHRGAQREPGAHRTGTAGSVILAASGAPAGAEADKVGIGDYSRKRLVERYIRSRFPYSAGSRRRGSSC
jgi:hypothetical protein